MVFDKPLGAYISTGKGETIDLFFVIFLKVSEGHEGLSDILFIFMISCLWCGSLKIQWFFIKILFEIDNVKFGKGGRSFRVMFLLLVSELYFLLAGRVWLDYCCFLTYFWYLRIDLLFVLDLLLLLEGAFRWWRLKSEGYRWGRWALWSSWAKIPAPSWWSNVFLLLVNLIHFYGHRLDSGLVEEGVFGFSPKRFAPWGT